MSSRKAACEECSAHAKRYRCMDCKRDVCKNCYYNKSKGSISKCIRCIEDLDRATCAGVIEARNCKEQKQTHCFNCARAICETHNAWSHSRKDKPDASGCCWDCAEVIEYERVALEMGHNPNDPAMRPRNRLSQLQGERKAKRLE